MKPLKVEFAPPWRVPVWTWCFIGALLLAVAAQQGVKAWRLWEQARAGEAEVAGLRSRIDQAREARREALSRQQAEAPYAKDAAEVAKVAGFPVERVLAAVESARVQGIKVTALDVVPAEGAAKLELEFSDHEALLRYLEAINAGEDKPRWVLVKAQLGGVGGQNVAMLSSYW